MRVGNLDAARIGSIVFLSTLAVAVAAERARPATQYYVSPSGSDGAAGTSGAPWKTLQHAADEVAAGDTVIVQPGTYAGFDLQTSGTANQRITFRAEQGVTINAPNERTPDGINLEFASYVTIEGFHVTGAPRAGIRAVGDGDGNDYSKFVIIRNNNTDQNGRWGIFTGHSDDLLIENNIASRSGLEHGIYVSNSADRPIVRNNVTWGNRNGGIQLNADGTLPGDGIITGAVVSGNIIHGNGVGGGSAINLDGVQSSVFQNNLLYDNHASGISLFRQDGTEGSKNNLVSNNTIVQAADGRWALNIQNGSSGNTVRNNVLYNLHSRRGAITISPDSLPGLQSDYNAVIGRFTTDDDDTILTLAQWRTESGQDQHSFVATLQALFADSAGGNYHLKPGSPAIDVGTALAAALLDLAGLARPIGAGFDIGAYEHLPGDVNYDARVDIFDVNVISDRWGTAGPLGDANGDGAVDVFDVNTVSDHWTGDGATTAVPEPAAIALAAIAAAMIACRRRVRR